MPELKSIQIDDYCFKRAKELLLVGLHSLESVSVGTDCFSSGDSNEEKPQGRFCLKDCEQLSRLQIGAGSFMDYSVCEIENLPKLLQLQIGKPKSAGNRGCFHWSSLELKSKMTESE